MPLALQIHKIIIPETGKTAWNQLTGKFVDEVLENIKKHTKK